MTRRGRGEGIHASHPAYAWLRRALFFVALMTPVLGYADVARAQLFVGFDDWGGTVCRTLGGVCRITVEDDSTASASISGGYYVDGLKVDYFAGAAEPLLDFDPSGLPASTPAVYFEVRVLVLAASDLAATDSIRLLTAVNGDAGYQVIVELIAPRDLRIFTYDVRGGMVGGGQQRMLPASLDTWQRVAMHLEALDGGRVRVRSWFGDSDAPALDTTLLGSSSAGGGAGSFEPVEALGFATYTPDVELLLDDLCVGPTASVRAFCQVEVDARGPGVDAGASGDGGVPVDGGALDAATAEAGTSRPTVEGPWTYHGGGGCSCQVERTRARRALLPMSLGTILFLLRRRIGARRT